MCLSQSQQGGKWDKRGSEGRHFDKMSSTGPIKKKGRAQEKNGQPRIEQIHRIFNDEKKVVEKGNRPTEQDEER